MTSVEILEQLSRLSIFDLPIAVYVVQETPGGVPHVVACNDRFRRIFGIPVEQPTPFESAQFYSDIAEREQLSAKFQAAKARGEDLEKLVIHLRATGDREVWVLDFTRAILAEDGSLLGTLCCLVDVTREENTKRLLDSLPVGLYHLGADDSILECNRQFAEMLGSSQENLVGRSLSSLFAEPSDAEMLHKKISNRESVVDEAIELINQHTGETLQASVSAARNGTGFTYSGQVGAVRDISKSERYRQLTDHLPLGLFKIKRSKNTVDTIEHCNEQFAKILGISPSTLQGQPLKSAEAQWKQLDHLEISRQIGDAQLAPSEELSYESELKIKQQATRVIRVNAKILRNKHCDITSFVGSIEDVTGQRKLQEKISRLTSKIGAILHAYTHTLTTLTQTIEPIGDFLGPDPFASEGGAAREIGRGDFKKLLAQLEPRAKNLASSISKITLIRKDPEREGAWDKASWTKLTRYQTALNRPLTVNVVEVVYAYFREIAIGSLEICRKLQQGFLPRELVRQFELDARELSRVTCLLSLASVKHAIVDMDSQVRALNDYLTRDQREKIKQDAGAVELVNLAIASQSEYFLLKNIELRNRLSEVPDINKLVIYGSKVDLIRAISNIIHNAIKYSWSHGREGSRAWIEIRGAYLMEGKIVFEFENWGVPIAQGELDLVFELGYRGQHSADRNRAGTGVGLHDSREVARDHSGEVTIQSIPAFEGDPSDPNYYSRPFITTVSLSLSVLYRKEF
jgi:PAS domain S-box-containing protein